MTISDEEKKPLYDKIKSSKDASVEDFCLSFYNPSNEKVELV